MKLENIKKYVNYYAYNYPDIDLLKSLFWLFAFFSYIALIASLVSKKIVFSSMLISLTLLYRIAIFVFQVKCKTPYFILSFFVKGALGTVISLEFLLLALTMLDASGKMSLIKALILLFGYVLSLIFAFLIVFIGVKNGRYDEKKKSRKGKKGKVFALLGSTAGASGFIFAKFASKGIGQDAAIFIMIFLALIIIFVFSFGTTEFLKCYYILHYPIVSEKEWEIGSERLMKEAQSKPWILGRVFLIFAIIVLSLSILGFFV